MKKYLYINILVLSSQLFSFGVLAGEVWGFPWFRVNNPDTMLREQMRVQNDQEAEATPEEMEALRELAEGVALNVLNEEEEGHERDRLREIAEDVAFNVLDEGSNSYTYEVSSDECAEESSDCCEDFCSDEDEAQPKDAPNAPALSNEENGNPKYKTQLCKHYMQYGECKFGANCKYAHGKKQLRAMNEKFKTTMCRNWKLYGRCFYGDSCHFAHGDGELRK